MIVHRLVLAASAALLAGGLSIGSASAMPVGGLAEAGRTAQANAPGGAENVRWVCGPRRCVWRPGPRWAGRRYYAPPRYYYGRPAWRSYRYGWNGPRRHYWR